MKSEIIDKFALLMISAFGLVAALAWNDAIKGYLQQFGLEHYGPWVYAIIVTLLAVIITVILGWLAQRAKNFELTKYAHLPYTKSSHVKKKKSKAKKR